jgi:hypothetical protein
MRERDMTDSSPLLDRIVLGDNQFFAVNHRSQEEAFAQAERFSHDESILAVMRMARDRDVGCMMLSSHPRAESLCDALRSEPIAWKSFYLYPCIPYAFKYVMALNEKGMYQVVADQIKTAGVGASFSMFVTGGLGLATGDYFKLFKVLIDLEMQMFREVPVRVVFLHNVVVDLILALGIEGLLRFFAEYVSEKHGARPGFGSLNLPLLAERMTAEGVEDAVIMTSVNKRGFFMNPSREACEEVLSDKKWNVMAMSILASGGISAHEAFPYAVSFPAVKSVLFGTSRAETMDKSLSILHSLGFDPGCS